MRKFLLFLIVMFSLNLLAQQPMKRKCATDEIHRQLIQEDPTYLERYNQLQEFVQKFVEQHPNGYSPKTVITVPIVVHIVLSPSQHQQFPDQRVYEQIDVLNRDFAGQNPHSMGPFSSNLKANTELQFCLATIDPNGNPTTGIERRDYFGGPWGTNQGVKSYAQGGLDAWDPNKYLNFWVCDLGNGLCGYALYPVAPLSNLFGLVNHWEYTGLTGAVPPYHLGGTATHEIGHCFNLKHIWGDQSGCSPDDDCNDTPLQDVETYGSPTGVVTDQCSPSAPGIMYMNFMDYVNDDTYSNFTPDQKTRIQACFAPGGPLYQLGQSTACGSTVMDPVHANFIGSPLSIPVGGTVNFTDQSTGNPTSWQWTFTGGTPSTSTQQNPSGIQYNAVGLYSVKLKVSNAISSDSITKVNYIEVYDPNAVHADFVGTPTTILAGGTVQFTDLSTNSPTSWSWQFPGGTPTSSTQQNPTVTYSTPGTYNVSLTASNGTSTDTETKVNYITVLDATQAPNANFIADFTLVQAGQSVNFTNLSTGYYDSLLWIFEGATPSTSNQTNPSGILYDSISCFNVTLILYSILGNDTLTKTDYICVLNPNYTDTVKANFHAITSRLIVQGGSVSFEDLSYGPITSWNWYFEGGTPSTSTLQNPMNIVYSTPGIYDVRLVVRSGSFSDTLVKTDYIVVTTEPWPDPNGFCDTTGNIMNGEFPLVFIHLRPNKWGYIPGHNQSLIKYYADLHVNYTASNVRGILVPVVKAYGANATNKVRFTIWDYDTLTGKPGAVLGYKDEIINNFTPLLYKSVLFNNPIPVNGKFFVGYQLYYNNPVDTFVVYMAPNRGQNGKNTLFLSKTPTGWMTLTQFFSDTLVYNTSLAIKVVGCLVGIEQNDISQWIVMYPNPANNKITLEIVEIPVSNVSLDVYDLMGRKMNVRISNTYMNRQFDIDITNLKQGVYVLRLAINDQVVVHRFTKL